MIKPKPGSDRIAWVGHRGQKILELNFSGRGVPGSRSLLSEYARLLGSLRRGEKARVLVDFEGAAYDTRLALAWKARLELFGECVGKSAVIGASRFAGIAIQGYSQTASFLDLPLGPQRAVIFQERHEALDWLTEP